MKNNKTDKKRNDDFQSVISQNENRKKKKI